MNRKEKGALGEQIAQSYLKKRGYKIIETNYRASTKAEIDIIAKQKDILCFVEVKLRTSVSHGYGREAVNEKKQEHIRYGAQAYIMNNIKKDVSVRFDVLEITISGEDVNIELIQNAF